MQQYAEIIFSTMNYLLEPQGFKTWSSLTKYISDSPESNYMGLSFVIQDKFIKMQHFILIHIL